MTSSEPLVSQSHPELFHYTNWNGLKGIYESNSLWAVRYDRMNDPNEFSYAKAFLVNELERRVARRFIQAMRNSMRFKRKLQKAGRLKDVVLHEVGVWVDTHYEAMFSVGRERHQEIPFCIPHITSFCSHSEDMDYERTNGLLSQWRGYGRQDGFALVFDSKKLEDLLTLETGKYVYLNAHFFDVIYDRVPGMIQGAFLEVIDQMTESYCDYVLEEKFERMLHWEMFQRTAGRLKHRGFFEEREVRFVLYPMYQQYADEFRDEPKLERKGPVKRMYLEDPKPHVSLFEDLGRPLPIKRIIVGPSENQGERVERVMALTGGRVAVHASETPYR